MEVSPGSFEVALFAEDVDSPDHPYAEQFRDMLETVAEQYKCRLLAFDVKKGTVSFSFDSDELTAEILNMLDQTEIK